MTIIYASGASLCPPITDYPLPAQSPTVRLTETANQPTKSLI
ncbi:hypothetical protein PN466_25515 [Roseofilum reptotaenium CS-1145]|nr:hypothetical protein [Roseofilum reptotaenium CS-1145]